MTGSDSNFLTAGLAIVAAVIVSFAGAAVLVASADDGRNTVVYHANNMTDDCEIVEDSLVFEDCMFSHPGHTFLGWSESADGTGAAHHPGRDVASDMVLYAYWASDDAKAEILLADAIAAYGDGPLGPFAISKTYSGMAIAIGPDDAPAHSQIIGVSVYVPSEAEHVYDLSVELIDMMAAEYRSVGITMTQITDDHGLDEGSGIYFSGTLPGSDGKDRICTVSMYTGYIGCNEISIVYTTDTAGAFTVEDLGVLIDAMVGAL